jgi:hypothetical protein
MTAMATAAPKKEPTTKKPKKLRGKQKRIAKMRAKPPSRYLITYDINGPRVRLGFLWFLLVCGAFAAGGIYGAGPLAGLYGAAGALAAFQAAKAWRVWGAHPEEYTAATIAGALGIAGAFGPGWVGVVALAAIPLALFSAFSTSGARSQYFGSVGLTLQTGLFVGVAAAAPALAYNAKPGAAAALILFVSVYDMGDFLIGSGSSNHLEGPIAGIAGIAVFTFAMAVVHLPPFGEQDIVAFGILAAVLCPLGQLFGSVILPRADAPASALRRLDSLLLLGPAWYAGLHIYADRI